MTTQRILRVIKAMVSCIPLVTFADRSAAAQQPCNEDAVMAAKADWKKAADANMKPGPNQTQAIIRIDTMAQLLRAAYPEPAGMAPAWYRSMNEQPLISGGPAPYQLRAILLGYFCNGRKPAEVVLGEETDTWFYVYANQFGWFFDSRDFTPFTVNTNRVYLLTKRVGEFQGYPMYEGIHNKVANTGVTHSRTIIMTRPGQSPYTPVTKRQFLTAYIQRLETEQPKQMAIWERRPVRSDAEEEANTQNELARIERTTRADKREWAKANYLKTHVSEKQEKEEGLIKMRKANEADLKPARDLLNGLSEEGALQPAIVDAGHYTMEFTSFMTEEHGGRMLVQLNPAYFKAALPTYVPQFLVVYWRWDDSKASLNFKNQLEAHFDFKALQALIDK